MGPGETSRCRAASSASSTRRPENASETSDHVEHVIDAARGEVVAEPLAAGHAAAAIEQLVQVLGLDPPVTRGGEQAGDVLAPLPVGAELPGGVEPFLRLRRADGDQLARPAHRIDL